MATQCMQMEFKGVQNTTFDENPHENERIMVILGCAIGLICLCKTQVQGWLAKTMFGGNKM